MKTYVCTFCNSTFTSLERTAKFCSSTCFGKHRSQTTPKKKNNVTCAWCSVEFYKTPSEIKASKSGLVFCTREHKDLAQRLGGLKEIQPSHYGTGNHISDYRAFAFSESLEHKCANCGYDRYSEVLQVHHKDRDRTNNAIDNLQILCPTCHMEQHFVTRTGLWLPKT